MAIVKELADKEYVVEKVTEVVNNSIVTETDPTVPAWAKNETKPTYTAGEVGAASIEQVELLSEEKVNKSGLTLGVHTDGLVYIFVDGVPHGNGLDIKTDVVDGDVFGYVDDNNVIVLNGALAEGTYTIKYEMDDGSTVEIGNLVLDNNVYYSITNKLTNCTNSNSATKAVQGEPYSATITAKSGYELKTVTVTMGGSPVSVSGGTISIAEVTGNIVITAVAAEVQKEPTNFADPTSADWINGARMSYTGSGISTTLTTKTIDGCAITNYVDIVKGDIVRVEGINFTDSNNRQGTFRSDGSLYGGVAQASAITCEYLSNITYDANSFQFTVLDDSVVTKARFSGLLTGTANDVVITITRNGTVL